MKKLILFICICSLIACKKDASKDITAYNWVLTSATISPSKIYNGKPESDYMLMDPSTCLKNNFTISFEKSGVYGYSSAGPLCDMVANDNTLKWNQDGKTITLTNRGSYNEAIIASVDNNQLTYTAKFNDNNVGTTYSVVYKFIAKSK